MSARYFNYFDDLWKTEVLECPKCHWLGTFEQGSVQYYDQLMDCHCPRCNSVESPMLAIVSYPTLEELRANQDKPGIREYVQRIDNGLDKFAREKLREPEQLPEIGEDSFALGWDNDDSNPDDRRTLIKYGEVIVFSEPARWEEYERFAEVAQVLKAKYGHRLRDLVPTPESENWLYGDKLRAADYVESVRDKLRSQSGAVDSGGVTGGFDGPDLPEIDVAEFSFVFDYSPDRSRYFVSQGKQVVLAGLAARNDPDYWEEEARGEQFIEIASRLKERYGAKLVDLVPTQRAQKMLDDENWGFSWNPERGRSIVQQKSTPSLPGEGRTQIISRMLELADARYPIEWVTAARERVPTGPSEQTQEQSDNGLPAQGLLQFETELPEINAEKFGVVFDYADDVSRYLILYGDQVILSGPAEHDVERSAKDIALRQQFIKIARKLKTRYGAKLVDLVVTKEAESLLQPLHAWIMAMIGA
jgi:hypothetical protein